MIPLYTSTAMYCNIVYGICVCYSQCNQIVEIVSIQYIRIFDRGLYQMCFGAIASYRSSFFPSQICYIHFAIATTTIIIRETTTTTTMTKTTSTNDTHKKSHISNNTHSHITQAEIEIRSALKKNLPIHPILPFALHRNSRNNSGSNSNNKSIIYIIERKRKHIYLNACADFFFRCCCPGGYIYFFIHSFVPFLVSFLGSSSTPQRPRHLISVKFCSLLFLLL